MPSEPGPLARRRTIALFVDWLDDGYQQSVMKGVLSAARERGADLYVFEGGAIHSTRRYEANRNVLYQCIGSQVVDGIVVLAGPLGHFATRDEMAEFVGRYRPLPMVSVSSAFDGIPALFSDNSQGMRQLVLHFVREHGFERIAYVGGPQNNQDAQERFEAYASTLRECGLAVDQQLVFHGDFSYAAGATAVGVLLRERGVVFEALIAANDNMALGAMRAFQSLGKKVPRDMAIAGFDDSEIAVHAAPPLTTVSQSFQEQGSTAAHLLLDRIEGKDVPARTLLPSRVVVRESCGCFSNEVMNVVTPLCRGVLQDGLTAFVAERSLVADAVLSSVAFRGDLANARNQLDRLLEGLARYLAGTMSSRLLLLIWNEFEQAVKWPGDYSLSGQHFVSQFRREVARYVSSDPRLQLEAENFFQQLRIIVGEKANALEKKEIQNLVNESFALHVFSEELLGVFEEQKITELLDELLPQLGIPSCFISRFEASNRQARLVFGLDHGQRVATDQLNGLYPSVELLPERFRRNGGQRSFVVEALCQQDQIGLAVFELGPVRGRLYGELRRLISARLQGALMFSQLQTQRNYLRVQSQTLSELRQAMTGMVQALSLTVEARDPYTAGHQRRVADLAWAVASEMGLPKDTIEGIRLAAMVHDLGKICLPAEILNKPGKLMPAEMNLIRVHSQVAYDILKTIEFPWPLAEIVHQHHERLDGSGYPQGLSGNGIRLEARIIGVADVVEAMASHRPYRPAVGLDAALAELRLNRGKLYDSDVVDACLWLFEEKGFLFK